MSEWTHVVMRPGTEEDGSVCFVVPSAEVGQQIIDAHPEQNYWLDQIPCLTDAEQWHDHITYTSHRTVSSKGHILRSYEHDRPGHQVPYAWVQVDINQLHLTVFARTPDEAKRQADAAVLELKQCLTTASPHDVAKAFNEAHGPKPVDR